ncbi:MAG: stage III sporulation protein SpoIIIAB [Clostridia bacterium]|nr:stage III sporulation protein SpoIIIAB [Clostridia bacterium]
MVLKIVGSLMVICASSLMGYVFARDCARRPNELRTLQGLLQMFETEISYMSNIITEAFHNISNTSSSKVSVFFSATVKNLMGNPAMNACEAWEKSVNENIKMTALNNEDKNILMSFGKMLGNSDLEGQQKNIRLAISQLKLQEQKAEENRKRNESMFKSLGVLGGIAIVIILI